MEHWRDTVVAIKQQHYLIQAVIFLAHNPKCEIPWRIFQLPDIWFTPSPNMLILLKSTHLAQNYSKVKYYLLSRFKVNLYKQSYLTKNKRIENQCVLHFYCMVLIFTLQIQNTYSAKVEDKENRDLIQSLQLQCKSRHF